MLTENRRSAGSYVMGASPYYLPAFGRGIGGDWPTVSSFDLQLASDPLRAELMAMEFRSPPIKLLELVGYDSPSGGNEASREVQHLGYKPSTELRVAKMNKLQGIADLLVFLGGKTSGEVPVREHAVRHENLIGRVDTHYQPYSVWPSPSSNAMRADCRVLDVSSGSEPYYVIEQVGAASSASVFVQCTTRAEARLPELKIQMQNEGFEPPIHDPDYNYSITSLQWAFDAHGNVNRVFYVVRVTSGGGQTDGYFPFLAFKEVAVCFTVDWEPHPYTDIPLGVAWGWLYPGPMPARFRMGRHLVRHMTRSVNEPPSWYISSVSINTPLSAFDDVVTGYGDGYDLFRSWICEGDQPSRFLDLIGQTPSGTYVDTNPRDFIKFTRYADQYSSDMLPAAYFAQGDALDEGFGILQTNILETALEIKDLASPIELGGDLYKLITNLDLEAMKVLPSSPKDKIFQILDFLSDWQLVYSFGYRPTEKLAKEYCSWVKEVSRKLRGATRFQTFYGSYKYDLSDGESPYYPANILGHSKLRLRVPPDSLLPALLPADQLGVLPTMSRIWDILPLSFILDWAFNISGKLEAIDLATKLAVLQVAYSVNSVSFFTGFTPSDQENYRFISHVDTDPDGHIHPTGYYHYVRYLLPTWQVMTPTRFGFLTGKGIPDMKVAASLVYKFLT